MHFSSVLATASFDFAAIFGNFLTKWYLYLVLGIFFAVLIVLSFILKDKRKINLHGTKKLTAIAVMVAFSCVANIFSIGTGDWQVSLIALVGFVCGCLFSPAEAFSICFIGDLIGCIIAPKGAYNPVIGIASALWALVPAILFSFGESWEYVKTIISFVVCFIVCSLVLNTIANYYMYVNFYSKSYDSLGAYFLFRLPIVSVTFAANLVAALLLLKPVGIIKKLLQ